MMQQEFERMVGTEVTAEDYTVIELVYMEHPLIPSAGGKAKVKALYEIVRVNLAKFVLIKPNSLLISPNLSKTGTSLTKQSPPAGVSYRGYM